MSYLYLEKTGMQQKTIVNIFMKIYLNLKNKAPFVIINGQEDVMELIKILNYQGNKASLMPFISENIRKYISPGENICDLFAGSGSVGAYLKGSYSELQMMLSYTHLSSLLLC